MAIIAGKNYTLNLAGVRLRDNQLSDVPRPYAELGGHITIKTVQAFGILGCSAGAATSAIQGKRDCDSLSNKAFTFGQYGVIAGLIVGPLLTAAFVRNKSRDSIADRAYRLRLNKNQVRADRWSILGSIIGAGAAYQMGGLVDQGALFGMCGGCVLAGVVNTIF